MHATSVLQELLLTTLSFLFNSNIFYLFTFRGTPAPPLNVEIAPRTYLYSDGIFSPSQRNCLNHVSIYVQIHLHIHTYTLTHLHTHLHLHTHTHTHTLTHTHFSPGNKASPSPPPPLSTCQGCKFEDQRWGGGGV